MAVAFGKFSPAIRFIPINRDVHYYQVYKLKAVYYGKVA